MKKWFCLMLMLMMTALPMAGAQENAKRFEYIWFCDEDYIEVVQDGKWGLMNFNGEMLIPCEWERMYEPWGGYVPVMQGGLWGLADMTGSLVLPPQWDTLMISPNADPAAEENYLEVTHGGKWGVLRTDGTVLLPCEYDYVGQMGSEPYPLFGCIGEELEERRYFVVTEDGAQERPEESFGWSFGYTPPEGYDDGFRNAFIDVVVLRSQEDGLYRLGSFDGSFHSEEAWEKIDGFREGYAAVKRDGKWGFIDAKGHLVIPLAYDRVERPFREGMAAVEAEGERFWINTAGQRLFDNPWEETTDFTQGVALVKKDGLWGMIDNRGNLISECRWEDAGVLRRYPFADGSLMPVVMDGLCGFVNLQGELVIPCVYDREQLLGDGWDTPGYTIRGDRVAIRQDGVLSIFASDGTQVY